jgi:hypothetical protein
MDAAAPLTVPGASRAEAIDRRLGDPHASDLPCSFARVVERDERESLAPDVYASIDDVAFGSPVCPGEGAPAVIISRAEVALIVRTIARRDPGLAFAWGCSAAAREVARGRPARGAIALLLPFPSIVARSVAKGYQLWGDCHLAPNLPHAKTMLIEASLADSRDYVSFAADRDALLPTAIAAAKRVRTVGLRTAPIGAAHFSSYLVPAEACVAVVDRERLEATAAGIAHVMVAAASLGLADTALRAAIAFARSRLSYGRTVFDIPHVRALVAEAAVDLIISECVVASACAPHSGSLRPDVAWYCVTRAVDNILRNVRVVLGARGYCREGHWHGIVEKLIRDQMLLRTYPTPQVDAVDIAPRTSERDLGTMRRVVADRLDAAGARGVWMAAALDRLARPSHSLHQRIVRAPIPLIDVVLGRVLELHESDRMFSLESVGLTRRGVSEIHS